MASKINNGLLFGGLAAAAGIYFYLTRKNVQGQLNLIFVNASFKFNNVLNSTITLNFDIVNTSRQAIPIQSITGLLQIGESTAGKILNNTAVLIPANSTKRISLPVLVNNLVSGKTIFSIGKNLKLPEVTAKLLFQTPIATIPFNQTISLQ